VLWVAQGVIALNPLTGDHDRDGHGANYGCSSWQAWSNSGFAFVGGAGVHFGLVGRRIGNAVVLQQLSMNSTRVIGPSIAGALIGIHFIGVAGVYYLTTLGFVIASLTLLKLPKGEPKRKSGRSPMADLLDGFRYVKGRPAVSQLILVAFAVMMLGFPYQSFLPALAKEQYGVGASGLGLLSSVAAIGAVTATIFVAAFAQHQKAWFAQPVLAVALSSSASVRELPDGAGRDPWGAGVPIAELSLMLTEQEYRAGAVISSMSQPVRLAALPWLRRDIGLRTLR
jgi:hypothetical protein